MFDISVQTNGNALKVKLRILYCFNRSPHFVSITSLCAEFGQDLHFAHAFRIFFEYQYVITLKTAYAPLGFIPLTDYV